MNFNKNAIWKRILLTFVLFSMVFAPPLKAEIDKNGNIPCTGYTIGGECYEWNFSIQQRPSLTYTGGYIDAVLDQLLYEYEGVEDVRLLQPLSMKNTWGLFIDGVKDEINGGFTLKINEMVSGISDDFVSRGVEILGETVVNFVLGPYVKMLENFGTEFFGNVFGIGGSGTQDSTEIILKAIDAATNDIKGAIAGTIINHHQSLYSNFEEDYRIFQNTQEEVLLNYEHLISSRLNDVKNLRSSTIIEDIAVLDNLSDKTIEDRLSYYTAFLSLFSSLLEQQMNLIGIYQRLLYAKPTTDYSEASMIDALNVMVDSMILAAVENLQEFEDESSYKFYSLADDLFSKNERQFIESHKYNDIYTYNGDTYFISYNIVGWTNLPNDWPYPVKTPVKNMFTSEADLNPSDFRGYMDYIKKNQGLSKALYHYYGSYLSTPFLKIQPPYELHKLIAHKHLLNDLYKPIRESLIVWGQLSGKTKNQMESLLYSELRMEREYLTPIAPNVTLNPEIKAYYSTMDAVTNYVLM